MYLQLELLDRSEYQESVRSPAAMALADQNLETKFASFCVTRLSVGADDAANSKDFRTKCRSSFSLQSSIALFVRVVEFRSVNRTTGVGTWGGAT
jgi:hypothetical protein